MRKLLISAALLITLGVVNASRECRFAPDFTAETLRTNQTARTEFYTKVLQHESKFIREVGVDQETGLTVSKVPLNKRTGMP